ncbi:hypothetical protein BGZ61DRAFT_457256 [Ilyonectria robusta]|uniref:uncharacterized protein n=1 Tax=Ilyonectria robusta TaxID=1079257 RepID=UPI001E8EE2B8|nr:uncharacterized protein BGZ61DRAFT_457256 [Ilyonectria robusta]KAH8676918.1 hypothetical protein BGZ61DRAFT_457256 [Ilyonectria robusta]
MRFLLPLPLRSHRGHFFFTATGCTCQQLSWTLQLQRGQDAQRSRPQRSGQSQCRRGDGGAEDHGPMQGVEDDDDDCFFFSFICFVSVSRRPSLRPPFARRHPLIHHPIHGDGDRLRPRARAGTVLFAALSIGAVLLFTPAVQHLEKIKSRLARLEYRLLC